MIIKDPYPEQNGSVEDPRLEVHIVSLGDEALVVAEGEVDAVNVGRFRAALDNAATRRVVLDLSGITFFDGAMLSALLAACGELRSNGGALVIRSVTPLCRRVLGVTGLESYLGLAEQGVPTATTFAGVNLTQTAAERTRGRGSSADPGRSDEPS